MASLYSPVQTYLDEQGSTTKLLPPEHPDFEAAQEPSGNNSGAQPALIARPQNAEDVQTMVRYCAQNNVRFVVRTGGHNSPGPTNGQDVLWIDLRDIDYVDISEDKKTVKVGGGVLFRRLTETLAEDGLLIPSVTMAGVGYTGWATLGGYGGFSALSGLGTDQVVNAKTVREDGRLVEARGEQLASTIWEGGYLGIIVELTINVYSPKQG